MKLLKVTYLPHIQEQYTVHSTQETIWVRGHGRIEKLKWAKIQKTSKKIWMKIPTSWFFQGLSPKKEKVLARWLAESWLLWLPEPEMPKQHINCSLVSRVSALSATRTWNIWSTQIAQPSFDSLGHWNWTFIINTQPISESFCYRNKKYPVPNSSNLESAANTHFS